MTKPAADYLQQNYSKIDLLPRQLLGKSVVDRIIIILQANGRPRYVGLQARKHIEQSPNVPACAHTAESFTAINKLNGAINSRYLLNKPTNINHHCVSSLDVELVVSKPCKQQVQEISPLLVKITSDMMRWP
jgi:hypothetical protein